MSVEWKTFEMKMDRNTQKWILGLIYIFGIAAIWIAASYIVQSVEDAGVSPFLVTFICNSLFMVYIPIVEISRHLENSSSKCIFFFWRAKNDVNVQQVNNNMESLQLLPQMGQNDDDKLLKGQLTVIHSENTNSEMLTEQVDEKGRWSRIRVAKVSLLICPFWFFAQLAFNFSLKYTTVTSNTILSSTSSLFTFLVSLAFLGETFTWVKLISVLLCMGGTIIVSLSDSKTEVDAVAANPVFGDILSLSSAAMYSIYVTLIRKKLPDEDKGEGQASTAQFLGFLGLFNFFIFLPVVMVLHFTKQESFDNLAWKQFGLIVGKGLLDNVLSDYLWVKATQLTSTTVATAGLSIQVPIAAVIDSITGRTPGFLEFIGATFVMLGFAGINVPSDSLRLEQGEMVDIVGVELGNTAADI